jgi:hypothetical protein
MGRHTLTECLNRIVHKLFHLYSVEVSYRIFTKKVKLHVHEPTDMYCINIILGYHIVQTGQIT